MYIYKDIYIYIRVYVGDIIISNNVEYMEVHTHTQTQTQTEKRAYTRAHTYRYTHIYAEKVAEKMGEGGRQTQAI